MKREKCTALARKRMSVGEKVGGVPSCLIAAMLVKGAIRTALLRAQSHGCRRQCQGLAILGTNSCPFLGHIRTPNREWCQGCFLLLQYHSQVVNSLLEFRSGISAEEVFVVIAPDRGSELGNVALL